MRERQRLPDMTFIRREIPIADVARELGIRVAGANTAHCWREGHQNGDRTPSMSFSKRNRAKCQVCDPDSKSPIDLVIAYQECSLKEAVTWLCARWPVPTIAKNTKLARRERWATSPVGFSAFPLEEFIRSGVWAALDDPARAILPVLFCFAERGTVSVSYRGLARYSGLGSSATVAKGFQQLKRIGILEALPRLAGSSFREPSSYRFTLDGAKFQSALSETHARLKLESGAERELLAQSRISQESKKSSPPKPNPGPGALYPGTVSLDSVTRTQVHALKNEACTFSPDLESGVVSEDSSAENKGTCESTRFNPCNTNSELSPNKKYEDIPRESGKPAENAAIGSISSADVITKIVESSSSRVENKTACTSARFNSCNTKESTEERGPSEVAPLVTSQASEIPPAQRCYVHGKATEWWARPDGGLVCNRCHPCPHGGGLIWQTPRFSEIASGVH